jgi:predicted nucleic acid-binding protein
MKILLDTNIIIDNFAVREPHNKNANKIFTLIVEERITGYINTSSVTDVYYILRKTFTDQESRAMITTLLNLLQAIEVTKNDCFTALISPMSDFEDALVTVCADKVDIDFIVTRDDEFLKIPKAVSPSDFLEKTGL